MTMSPSVRFLAVVLLLAPLGAQDWVPLFNGANLDGWRASENPDSFRVDEGKIVVHGPRAHLFYAGAVEHAEFENFEVEAEILTKEGANSGFYFHTKFQENGWPAQGYEVQVNTSHSDTIKTGSLYGVVNVSEAKSQDDAWFTLNVQVRRQNICVKVDGQVVVNWNEPPGVTGGRRLSRGTFALQAHDPKSEVWYRKISVRSLPRWSADLSRGEKQRLKPEGPWWERMDYGPFLTSTFGTDARGDRHALKGVTVFLGPSREAAVNFDTDLLRMTAGWMGTLKFSGTPYDGSHGGHPYAAEQVTFETDNLPGWPKDGSREDPRPIPHGPIPDSWGQWKGLFRHGDDVVLSYSVRGMDVLEQAALEVLNEHPCITRTLRLGASKAPATLVVADLPKEAHVTLELPWTLAVVEPPKTEPIASEDRVSVLVDRTEGLWASLSMGAPSKDDFANNGQRVTYVPEFAAPHPQAGALDGVLVRANDGESAKNHDDLRRNVWLDGGPARVMLDLGSIVDIQRINTFTWHRADRSPQKFTLWASATEVAPEANTPDLAAAGWKRVIDVDSTGLGFGGKHGSSVTNGGGIVGAFRHLLWATTPIAGNQGMFLSEVDVWTADQPLRPFGPRAHLGDQRPLSIGLKTSQANARLLVQETDGRRRLVVTVPAGETPRTIKLSHSRDVAKEECEKVHAAQTNASDLLAKTRGGAAIFGPALELQGTLDTGEDAPWVVDTVPIPFENPWNSEMRIGGFDFFSDSKRAAVCTWNGDVWIVSGLDETFQNISWQRFATGLFEPLGLCIVDDLVHVNGRDQITRLHDLNGDGEADFYECFNNDVLTTRNFHEFTFDLQRDREGNFYFSKAGPVRGGGRGFEKIIPHHGTVLKLSKDGKKLEVYARGMRAPNGIGVGPNGQITAGDNEGTWVPHCKLHWLKPGSFQGVVPLADTPEPPTNYNKPLCWFPMEVDNSGGSQVWIKDDRFGPFSGDLLHLSYGTSSIYKVMMEEIDGQIQGGVFRLPINLRSSAMRARFNPKDGQLWVCGLRGWQTNAAKLTAFQRVRRTQAPVRTPKGLRVAADGIFISFTCKLDRELAEDPESYALEQWNYVWGPQYGSPDVSVRSPDPEILQKALETELKGQNIHDRLTVTEAKLQPDGNTVFLRIEDFRPAMQMHIKMDLESEDKKALNFDIWNTIHRLGAKTSQ